MKKKVLILNTKYTIFGGEDANIEQEIKLLEKEFEIEYLEFKNKKYLNFYDIISFFVGNNFQSNKILKQRLSKFNPDIVYVHNTWYKAGLGVFNILEKHKSKNVLKIHNFRYDCTRYFLSKNHLAGDEQCKKCGYTKIDNKFFNKYFPKSYLKSFFAILYGKKYFKILKNNSINIIVLNRFHKNYLLKTGVTKKAHIVSNPLNLEKIKNNYNSQSTNIIYAGQVSEQKGIDSLLEAWSKFQKKNLVLNIIGAIVDEKLIKNYKNINFLGELSNFETLEMISKARAVITTTKMYEGQPRLLSEASILGIPSIFPSFGGMDEYFPNNYPFKYIQYDYQNLDSKLNKLHNIELLVQVSKEITDNYKSKFNNEISLNNLKKVFES